MPYNLRSIPNEEPAVKPAEEPSQEKLPEKPVVKTYVNLPKVEFEMEELLALKTGHIGIMKAQVGELIETVIVDKYDGTYFGRKALLIDPKELHKKCNGGLLEHAQMRAPDLLPPYMSAMLEDNEYISHIKVNKGLYLKEPKGKKARKTRE